MTQSPELLFLQDMAIITLVAAVTIVLFHRLRLSAVLGYILAGIIVGPHTPPFSFVHDEAAIRVLGQLGVVFLLFAVGLEFNIPKLRRVGLPAVLAATVETVLMIWVGYAVGRAFGLDHLSSVFLGAIVSVSSTTIIVKVLEETGQKDAEWARVMLGITLVEDVLAVILLTVLSTAGGAGAGGVSVGEVGGVLLRLGLFLGAALVLGPFLVPRLVGSVARVSQEVLVIASVGLAFGMALLAAYLGFSTALGAFVMGALVAESAAARDVERGIAPLRDLFAAVFFVTVGMLLDPAALVAHAPLVLAVAAAILVGKTAAASAATFVVGYDARSALRIGSGLVPLGEFSFVLAAVGVSLGLDAPLYAVAVGASALTAFAAPFLIRGAPRAFPALARLAPRPLLTYGALYAAWVARLRGLGQSDPARGRSTRLGAKTVLYGAATIAVLAAGAYGVETIGRVVAPRLPVEDVAVALAGWATVGAAVAPLFALFVVSLRAFVDTLAEAALPEGVQAGASGASVRVVLRHTFLLTGFVTFAAALGVATAPVLPTGPVLAAVGAVVVLSGALLYRALGRFQRRVDEALTRVIAGGAEVEPAREERRDLLALIREQYPWSVSAREVTVAPHSAWANRTLREIHLRAHTGATVVAIHRGARHLVNPDPDAVILPGDRLGLVGDDPQLDSAEAFLARRAPEARAVAPEDAAWREVAVFPESALAGQTLAGARIRERTGATVVGVVRGGERLMHPVPQFRFQAGDVLLVVGAEAQTDRVRELAAAHAEDGVAERP